MFIRNPHIITDISIITPSIFKEATKGFKEVSPFPYYRVTDGISSNALKVTYNSETCAILGMSNGKETYIGHFAPEIRKSDFTDKLDYIIKKFQDATGYISAIITGGHDYNRINLIYKSKESYNQLADIGALLDKNNVNNLTMIAAKKESAFFVDNLAISEGEFLLAPRAIRDNNPLKLSQNMTSADLENVLKKNYSIVEVDSGHKIDYKV